MLESCRKIRFHAAVNEFLGRLEQVALRTIGLDQNPIELAVSRANAAPLPPVLGFSDERIRLLAAICREIQQISGTNPFFLPTRKLGEVLGAHWTQVARWLRALEVLKIIHLAPGEIRIRGGKRSPRYYYGPTRSTSEGVLIGPDQLALPEPSHCLTKQAA